MMILSIILLSLIGPPDSTGDHGVRKATEVFIRERLALPREDVSVEFRSVPVVPWYEGMMIRVAPEGTFRLIGNVSLPVEIEVGGSVVWRSFVSVRIRIFRTALVAIRTIDRHEPISMVDVVAQRTEIRDLSERLVKEDDQLHEKRASRRIRGGSIIMESVLEPVPIVKANDPVTIVATSGNVVVTIRGIAREDGRMGDRIVVQKADSSERIKGKVVGPATVSYIVESLHR